MANRADKQQAIPQMDGPRALRPEEHAAALRLIHSALRPKGPPAMQKEYPLVLGKKNMENMRVIVGGGEVISHAAIYFSTLRSGNLAFKVGGISSVATHSAYRGRGLGSKVMRDCIGIMRDRACHLSILWTQRQSFYRNLGYESAGSSCLFKPTALHLSNASSDCRIVPYAPARLPDIIEIHNRESFRTERTAKEYETYLALPKTRTLLAMRGGKVSAYAVMGKGEDLRGCMHDWGGDPRDLLRLARELAALSETGAIMILAPTRDSELARLLMQMNIPKSSDYLAMIRVIDAEGLSSVVGNHVSGLLGKDFRIVQERGGARIKIDREEETVEPERMLARVLFGPDQPSSLLTGFSRETLSALDRALPIPLYIWGLDSV